MAECSVQVCRNKKCKAVIYDYGSTMPRCFICKAPFLTLVTRASS